MNEVRPFKEYKEMIQGMTKEEMVKGLYDLSKNNIEKDKEIERLNNILDKINRLFDVDTHCENIYYAIGTLLKKEYFEIEMIDNEEILDILGVDKDGDKFTLEIDKWTDYEGEQLQVISNSKTYLISANKSYFIKN